MTNFKSVKKFMETFGQEIREKASFPDDKITSLRYDLIKEELEELQAKISVLNNLQYKSALMFLLRKLQF